MTVRGVASSSSSHLREGLPQERRVEVDLEAEERVGGHRFDAKWLTRFGWEVLQTVGDEDRRADMHGKRQHVAVLLVHGHRAEQRRRCATSASGSGP